MGLPKSGLKTKAEHNAAVFRRTRAPKYTGVACSNCGTEMQFVGFGMMLSSPPQKDTKCFNCGKEDRIYV